MPLTTISHRRSLTSYATVQSLIGPLLRNRRFQLRRPRVQTSAYLDIGCGPNTHATFINLDYFWHPGVDVCWDVTRGLPFAGGTMRGVFTEHCLEHFALPEARALMREIRRVLAPGGHVRIVVPDGELYLRTYVQQLGGNSAPRFPYQDDEEARGCWSPMVSVNRIFYQDRESMFGHRTIYDFPLLKLLLRECGFDHVVRRAYGEGADPKLLVDTLARKGESLYAEASWGPSQTR